MTTTRIIRIAVGYAVACVAAVLGCWLPLLPLLPAHPTGAMGPRVVLDVIANAAVFALVPSLAAIACAERRRIRSRWAYVAMGAGIGAATVLLFAAFFYVRWGVDMTFTLFYVLPGTIPGMIGGLAYHAAAGRAAGGDDRAPPAAVG